METWYERFEYSVNPFTVKPDVTAFVNLKDVTMQMIHGLAADNFILLSGAVGSGKTTTLLFLKNNITKPLTPIYHNCVYGKELDLRQLLAKRDTFFDRLLKRQYRKKDNVLLFLDECQLLTEKELEQVKAFYDSGELKSVVLASSDMDFVNESIKDRVSVDLRIRPLAREETAELIKKRIGNGVNPFTIEAMYLIGEASDYNPRRILKNCERVLFDLFKKNQTPAYVTPEHVSLVLGVPYVTPTHNVMERRRVIEEVTRMPAPAAPMQMAPADDIVIVDTPKPVNSQPTNSNLQASFEAPVEARVEVRQEIRLPDRLEKLSPLQKEIIASLAGGGKSYDQLCQELNKSRDTIAKQVSRLCLLSDKDIMKKRGIEKPVISKNTGGSQIVLELAPEIRSIMER